MTEKTWDELKQQGSEHYRGLSQPIDIYKSKGTFKAFALCSIAKYAVRNMDKALNPKDMEKIIHFSELLLAECRETHKELGGKDATNRKPASTCVGGSASQASMHPEGWMVGR